MPDNPRIRRDHRLNSATSTTRTRRAGGRRQPEIRIKNLVEGVARHGFIPKLHTLRHGVFDGQASEQHRVVELVGGEAIANPP